MLQLEFRVLFLLLALVVPSNNIGAAIQAAPIPPQKPEISTSTNLIEVPLVARSSNGRPIENLKADDLVILDNGSPQKISFIESLDFDQRQKEFHTDVVSSGANKSDLKRYFVIVIPRLDFGSRYRAIEAVKKALREGRFGKADSIAIIDNSGIFQPITTDLDRTQQTIALIQSKALGPCWEGDWFPTAHQLLSTLRQVNGRKFIVMFTDSPTSGVICFRAAANSPFQLISDALAANASIYPVDTRGVEVAIPFGDATQSEIPRGVNPGPSILRELSIRNSELAQQRSDLTDAALSTGGRVLAANNDLSAVFRMIDEDSTYYRIGYYLNDLKSDGQFHAISILTKRDQVRLLHKPGYFAPILFSELSEAKKREFLYQALLSDMPLAQIEFAASSYVFPDTRAPQKSNVILSLQMRWWVPRNLPMSSHQGVSLVGLLQQNGFQIAQFAKEAFWAAEPSQTEGEFVLRSARYNILISVSPGNYDLRLGAADVDANILGSSLFTLHVLEVEPRKGQGSFLGPLVVAHELMPLPSGERQAHVAADPMIWGEKRVIPAPVPLFAPNSSVYLFTRVYGVPSTVPGECRLLVRDTNSRIVASVEGEAARGSIGEGTPFIFKVDVKKLNLPKGIYKAEVELEGSHARPSTAFFRIEPSERIP